MVKFLTNIFDNLFRENKDSRPIDLNAIQNRGKKLQSSCKRQILGSPRVYTASYLLNKHSTIPCRELRRDKGDSKIANREMTFPHLHTNRGINDPLASSLSPF
jgi:hypothetical protein